MNPETVCNHALVVILTEYSFCTDIYILYFEIALVLASLIPEGIFESYCTSWNGLFFEDVYHLTPWNKSQH